MYYQNTQVTAATYYTPGTGTEPTGIVEAEIAWRHLTRRTVPPQRHRRWHGRPGRHWLV